ncbi:SUMO-interacting motif-containing protein 1 [Syngnathoides biaculeatus]|uniref:SUMO-interacting motif-containing protein 1 n=1 Tax=Syngnathoides biaculeatus TaxID=300417 RepID=UPI002ADD89AD|nr:SUMO-interacting motif-containing protein 1 [Syngnathoides biaculeatus]
MKTVIISSSSSSDCDSDEDDSDVEFVCSYHISATETQSRTAGRADVRGASINPVVSVGKKESTQMCPEVKLHENQTDFYATSLKKRGQEEENAPRTTSNISNEPDLHTHASSEEDYGNLKPKSEAISFQFETELHSRVHVPEKMHTLEMGEREGPHSGQKSSVCFNEDIIHTLQCPGQLQGTRVDKMDDVSSSQHVPSSWQGTEDVTDAKSNSFDPLTQSIAVDYVRSKSEDLEDFWANGDEADIDSPPHFMWQEESNEEGNPEFEFRGGSQNGWNFVCPVMFQRLIDGLAHTLVPEENVNCETSKVECQQRLSLVYITMDENYHEGTLQLLSGLLRPGYGPPKDVMSHLLSGILLDPLCPHDLCVQAWNLLMMAQRYHLVDKNTVPWSWEMLTSVMSSQDKEKNHRPEVVRMLLEYIVQTLEDDFSYNKSRSIHHSIAKATLSCNQLFPQVQDVIQWLISAVIKSTQCGESSEAGREKDEHIRIVSILQRMLCLALEVDCSPALTAPKLSQELFFALISTEHQRAQRLLLLNSLQSNLLRMKLLERLLNYACLHKTPLPMSFSRLLYFLENCTLAADPTDNGECWKKWEELVQHLWMLLVSYDASIKGYLYGSVNNQKTLAGSLVYKPDDTLTKAAICEAVEAFLARSQADVGQALPPHVEESLTYLQDFLLDVCE